MKRSALFAASVLLATGPVVGASPAYAAGTSSMTTSATSSLTAQQAAAREAADRFAAEAAWVSSEKKARNADELAALMNAGGFTLQERAIAIGKTQLGTMYRWGGTTPSGFDCSGFTKFAFGKAGQTLPRTARMQQRAVHKVHDPQPGDLVFYGVPAHHVAIYLGDGMMLHSPRTGKPLQIAKVYRGASYGRI